MKNSETIINFFINEHKRIKNLIIPNITMLKNEFKKYTSKLPPSPLFKINGFVCDKTDL